MELKEGKRKKGSSREALIKHPINRKEVKGGKGITEGFREGWNAF